MKSFGTFRLDTTNLCVWRGQERLNLTPKAFDVLRYLAEHAGRLVSQDEMLDALWPETYVNAEVVKKYVLEIRKALGDPYDKPEYVATFRRRGYQFIAAVHEEMASPCSMEPCTGSREVVGRESTLAQLQDAVNKISRGQRQIVFVTGESGIGKTTLVDVFLQGLGRDARIARGQCVEGFGGKEAYYPVLEALGQLLNDSRENRVAQTLFKKAPTWLAQFTSVVSDEQREALEQEIKGASRDRMVREICEALEAISAQEPLILCLEDLHWVDPSTLDIISALARRRGSAKLLVLATYRPADAMVAQSPLQPLKQDLLVHDLCVEIALQHLGESDIEKYLGVKFGDAEFPSDFANAIYRQCGGNALFLVTLLQDMVKKGTIAERGKKWTLTVPVEGVASNTPETLDDLVDVQFRQLSEIERGVLRSASVAGEHFSVWSIAGTKEDSIGVEDTCERLAERTQFIKFAGIHEMANGQISAHYDFVHSFYREAIYRRLSDVSRSRLHLRLAQRLKAVCEPCEQEFATELALHFERGYDYEQAIHYLIQAAEKAEGRFAYGSALENLNYALKLAAKVRGPKRNEYEIRILNFIGDAHFAMGALNDSAAAYLAAAKEAAAAGLKTAQTQALICAMYPLGFVNPDQGLAAMDEAVRTSRSLGDPLQSARAQMLAASCRVVFDRWSQEDAEVCRSAYETLSLPGNPVAAYEQIAYGHFLILSGRYREALQIFEDCESRSERRDSLITHFGALSGKTMAHLRMGRLGEVLRITRAARETSDENQARAWLLSFREAWVRILAFDFDGAFDLCEPIYRASAHYHPGQPQTMCRMVEGYIALKDQEYGSAIEHFTEAVDSATKAKFFLRWSWQLMARLELANSSLLRGHIGQARETADDLLDSVLSTADPFLRALVWELQARIAMAEGDLTSAGDRIQRGLELVRTSEMLVPAWQIHRTAWQLHVRSDEKRLAELHREQAEGCIFAIAESFEADEPLRATFLDAEPVRQVLENRVEIEAFECSVTSA